MNDPTPTIIGAGLAGLLAAHAWPRAVVYERAEAPKSTHRAVLRFRSPAAAVLTGQTFKVVKVRKGIWSDGAFVQPNVRVANHYALKVLGRVAADRSIWNLANEERFIAPDDFYERMVEAVGDRIRWGVKADIAAMAKESQIVTTIPLPAAMRALQVCPQQHPSFAAKPITVMRIRIHGVNAYQTVYFPDPGNPMYRASLEGDTLICEFAGEHSHLSAALEEGCDRARLVFGLENMHFELDDYGTQPLGKIEPLPDGIRKSLLYQMSRDHGVFSLGRFATWRNVLLDDVVNDIQVIKQLLRADSYDLSKAAR